MAKINIATKPSLFRSTGVVSLMTLLSRILGFLRDVAFAVFIGVTGGMDAFLVAFKIPNFMRRLFAEGAFAQSFVPVLNETESTQGKAEVKALVDVVAGTLGTILLAVTALGIVAAPGFILIFAPGFYDEPDKFQLSYELLRLTFPYLFFISLTAFAGGILNTYQRFAVPAFTPVLLNICLISAAVIWAPYAEEPVWALAVGVFIAGGAQLAFQFPFLRRLGMLPRPRWGWKHPKVQRIIKLMIPILFGSSIAQLNLLIDTLLASLLVTGSITWLYYSDRLMEFPLGIFSIAIATVILPNLSARFAEESKQAFSDTLDWALRMLALICIPAMLGLFVLAGPLIATLFDYGKMTDTDVYMVRYSLMAYALGFLGFSLVKVLLPAFYSRQDSITPVRCGIRSLVAAMAMNGLFVFGMMWLGWPAVHTGLALGTSLGAFVNAGLLYHELRKAEVYHPNTGWGSFMLRVILASGLMAGGLWWYAGDLTPWLQWGLFERVYQLLLLVGGGAVFYFAVLGLSGFRPAMMRAP